MAQLLCCFNGLARLVQVGVQLLKQLRIESDLRAGRDATA